MNIYPHVSNNLHTFLNYHPIQIRFFLYCRSSIWYCYPYL